VVSNPVLSVLVIAHERKEFIIDAIESLRNQSEQDGKYEVIVVKKFEDKAIDSLISSYGYQNLVTDKDSLGKKIYEALSHCNGQFICFLEDDDLFYESKVEEIFKIFTDQEISFINNNYDRIDKSGNLIQFKNRREKTIKIEEHKDLSKKFIDLYGKKEYFGMSNISIRKKKFIPYTKLLESVNVSPDLFFFIVLNKVNGKIIFYNKILTLYRIHVSLSNIKGDYSQFLERRQVFWTQVREDVNNYFKLLDKDEDSEAIRLLEMLEYESTIHLYLTSDCNLYKLHFSDVVKGGKILMKTWRIFYLKLLLMAIICYISPKLSRKLYYYVLK
jgi:glycosyltransferase involved in cell wall biosynthesis